MQLAMSAEYRVQGSGLLRFVTCGSKHYGFKGCTVNTVFVGEVSTCHVGLHVESRG